MKRALLIAEKPSLMRDVMSVYNKHRSEISYEIDFESQRGHLMTLMLPDELDPAMKEHSWRNLPFFPDEHGGWKYKIIEEKKQGNYLTSKERYDQIREKLASGKYDFIIHAGDPDQEGELLINIVLHSLETKLPVARFWTNDLTEGHILNALQHLRNDREDERLVNLLEAAYVRQHSDYLFGMNISRGASQQMHGRAACGRVKTFIQAVVVQREDAIANFTPSTVYGVKAVYTEGFEGNLYQEGGSSEDEDDNEGDAGTVWFDTKEQAEELIASLGNTARVTGCEVKHSKTYSPKLFKLSTVQMVAGKRGYNPDTTLNIVQTLYEKYKVMSYPRTSCEYMGSDEDFSGILHALYHVPELAPYIRQITKEDIARVRKSKKWVNDKELESKGHSALRPTTTVPDLSKMTEAEKEIYLLIAKRFVAMFLPPWQYDTIRMTTEIDGSTFRSSGKVTSDEGYLKIFGQSPEDTGIPEKKTGDLLRVDHFDTNEKTSKCPSHLTEADLIAICENPAKYLDDQRLRKLGKRLIIGTEATRAGIIRQLIDKDAYLEEFSSGRKQYVRATPQGTAMIRNLEGLLITKPDMTGEWEIGLESVREGSLKASELEARIRSDMVTMLEEIHGKSMGGISNLGSYLQNASCPFCGQPVIATQWGFACSAHSNANPASCGFSLRRSLAGAEFKDKDIEDLCRKGRTPVKTFISKKDPKKKYRAMLAVNAEEKKIVFEFPSNETSFKCPKCGEVLIRTGKGYVCKNFRESCDFAVWNTIANKKIADKDLKLLHKEGITDWIKGFKSEKNGVKKTFSAKLKLDNNRVVFSFEHSHDEQKKKKEESETEIQETADNTAAEDMDTAEETVEES